MVSASPQAWGNPNPSPTLTPAQAYEQVEDEAIKAERARGQTRRAKELMEKQMVQCKNLEQAFLQVKKPAWLL